MAFNLPEVNAVLLSVPGSNKILLEFFQGTRQLILVHKQLLSFDRQLLNGDRQVLSSRQPLGGYWMLLGYGQFAGCRPIPLVLTVQGYSSS